MKKKDDPRYSYAAFQKARKAGTLQEYFDEEELRQIEATMEEASQRLVDAVHRTVAGPAKDAPLGLHVRKFLRELQAVTPNENIFEAPAIVVERKRP